jgi:hypothetical protein
MNVTETVAVVGVSRRKSGLSALGVLVLLGVGWVYASLQFTLGMFGMVGIGLLFLLAIVTSIQALTNGSVIWSVLLSLGMPVGMVLAELSSGLPVDNWFPLGAAFVVGMIGHLLGMEFGRVRGTAARKASDREQLALSTIVFLVMGLIYFF